MKRYQLILLLVTILTLVSGCNNQAEPAATATGSTIFVSAATRTEAPDTPTSVPPTATIIAKTGSPTPNLENDRPEPPTEGPKPTSTRTIPPSATITLTPSDTPTPSNTPTPSDTPTPGPSPTPTRTFTPSQTPTGTLPTPTPSFTPSRTPTPTPTFTPSNTPTPTFTPSTTPTPSDTAPPSIAFTIEFSSLYNCDGMEILMFFVENTGDYDLEYSWVLIIDLDGMNEVTRSYTNWPFHTKPDGCEYADDRAVLPPGQSLYLPVPVGWSPAPPPYPGEHEGTFKFCSEDYPRHEEGVCRTEKVTFTIPGTE